MKLSREILLAYVEGALPPEEERRVAAEVAKDGALYAYVEEQKRLNARLHTAFAAAPGETLPSAPETPQAGNPTSPFVAFAAQIARGGRTNLTFGPNWIPVTALAAGIVLGVVLAGSFGVGTEIRSQGGVLTAQGNLARLLTTQLASEQNEAPTPVRIGTSFFSAAGFFCREFETRGPQGALAGIACRENGVWRIAALAQAESRAATALRSAGFDTPAAIRSARNAMMTGEPLSEDAERTARAQGWRPR